MAKYLRVTHTYLVPMPEDLPDNDPKMESAMNAGVSMMENHMVKLYADPRRCVNLQSSWEIVEEGESKAITHRMGMGIEKPPSEQIRRSPRRGPLPPNPSEFDRITSLRAIEGDFDGGVSFAQDVMGQKDAKVPHPWDQGLFIFPEGHPLRALEEAAKRGDGNALEAFDKAKAELTEGGDSEVPKPE